MLIDTSLEISWPKQISELKGFSNDLCEWNFDLIDIVLWSNNMQPFKDTKDQTKWDKSKM